jgi:hypothetical protein
MNRFLRKIFIFLILPLLSFLFVFSLENGKADPFYHRFISPKQNSLILGTSRAAQGIQPAVLNEILDLEKEKKFFNYSFTVMHSPYGEIYTNSIVKKLDLDKSIQGVFILAVDPWSLSSIKENPDDQNLFLEKGKMLDKLIFVHSIVNIQYFIKYYEKPFYEILVRKFLDSQSVLHKDGWLEIKINDEDKNYPKRLRSKINLYKENFNNASYSKSRMESFLRLIEILQKKGQVYMVRLPVDKEILKIENELIPEFDELINNISIQYSVPYLDLSCKSSSYRYTDGNHLEKSSGKIVSMEIAKWMKPFRSAFSKNLDF